MREKYFEDLGLDDGEEILKKFKIDVDEILNNDNCKSNEDTKQQDNQKK